MKKNITEKTSSLLNSNSIEKSNFYFKDPQNINIFTEK